MFTKIAKVALWFFIVIGVIMSVVLAVSLSSGRQNFWWIMPVGWIVTFVTASAFGTFVEISEHTRKTNELLSELANFRGGAPQNVTSSGAPQNVTSSGVPQADANGDAPQKDDFWRCPQCNAKIPSFLAVCTRCGNHK